MSDNIKYYYLKLKDNFFDSEEMKILESQKNGIQYQNLYLKLCLLSLKSDGRLIFKDYLPYDVQMLSTVLRVDIDTVKTGIEIFCKMGLIEVMDTGLIFMTDIQSLIGTGSTEGDRKKAYRQKIEEYKKTDNGQMSGQNSDIHPPEREIELKLELKKEREINKKGFAPPTFEEISQFCDDNNISIDVAYFIDYYSSNGWLVGKNKMKDWQATVRNWSRREKWFEKPKKQSGFMTKEDSRKESDRFAVMVEDIKRRKNEANL